MRLVFGGGTGGYDAPVLPSCDAIGTPSGSVACIGFACFTPERCASGWFSRAPGSNDP